MVSITERQWKQLVRGIGLRLLSVVQSNTREGRDELRLYHDRGVLVGSMRVTGISPNEYLADSATMLLVDHLYIPTNAELMFWNDNDLDVVDIIFRKELGEILLSPEYFPPPEIEPRVFTRVQMLAEREKRRIARENP